MKKISFNMPDIDLTKEQLLIEQLLRNDLVKNVLIKYDATRKAVEDNPYIFMEWLESLENNKDSYGSVTVINSDEMYYKDIEIEDDIARIVIKKTSWQKNEDQKYAFVKNYLICDLSKEQLDYSLDNVDLSQESESYKKVFQIVQQWLQALPDKGMFLWGGLGVGKTFLVASVTNALAKKGHKVAFVNVPSFFAQARNSVGVKDETKKEDFIQYSLRRLRRADFLVLDDIGAENVTNWVRDDILLPVLNYRMENKKSTSFTSNSNFADLRERLMYNQYGQKDEMKADRIMERIRTLSVEIKLDGNSRRR